MLRRVLPFLGVLIAFAGMAPAGPCCRDWDEKDPVKVTVVVILAREDGDKIDGKLKAIAEEVRKVYPSLKSFSVKTMHSKEYAPGEKVSLPVIDKQKLDLVIKHGADKQNRVTLVATAPSMGPIEYQSVCNKFLPIVTPYKTKANERLILAIRVQPCRGD